MQFTRRSFLASLIAAVSMSALLCRAKEAIGFRPLELAEMESDWDGTLSPYFLRRNGYFTLANAIALRVGLPQEAVFESAFDECGNLKEGFRIEIDGNLPPENKERDAEDRANYERYLKGAPDRARELDSQALPDPKPGSFADRVFPCS